MVLKADLSLYQVFLTAGVHFNAYIAYVVDLKKN